MKKSKKDLKKLIANLPPLEIPEGKTEKLLTEPWNLVITSTIGIRDKEGKITRARIMFKDKKGSGNQ